MRKEMTPLIMLNIIMYTLACLAVVVTVAVIIFLILLIIVCINRLRNGDHE